MPYRGQGPALADLLAGQVQIMFVTTAASIEYKRLRNAPQATGIEVVATQPTKADRATLAMFESTERKTLPGAAYIVKVRLKTLPEPTSRGLALANDAVSVGGALARVIDESAALPSGGIAPLDGSH